MAMQELRKIHKKLQKTKNSSLQMSMRDVHIKGLFSLVFDGDQAGHLTRAYIANNKVEPFDAQLHSHSYNLKLTVLKGRVTHHLAKNIGENEMGAMTISAYKYKSPLKGRDGILIYSHQQIISIEENVIPPSATIFLNHSDIHTVSCSKGAVWIVEELGFQTKETIVLGTPFCLEGLYRKPEQFEINDNYQTLKRLTQDLLKNHIVSPIQ